MPPLSSLRTTALGNSSSVASPNNETLMLKEYDELRHLICQRQWNELIHHLEKKCVDANITSNNNFYFSNIPALSSLANCSRYRSDDENDQRQRWSERQEYAVTQVPPIILNESPLPRDRVNVPIHILMALAHTGEHSYNNADQNTDCEKVEESKTRRGRADERVCSNKNVRRAKLEKVPGNSSKKKKLKSNAEDKSSGTPLRMAIRHRAPPDVIAALLHLFPGAAAIRHGRHSSKGNPRENKFYEKENKQFSILSPSFTSSSSSSSSPTGSHNNFLSKSQTCEDGVHANGAHVSAQPQKPLPIGELPLHEAAKRHTTFSSFDPKKQNIKKHLESENKEKSALARSSVNKITTTPNGLQKITQSKNSAANTSYANISSKYTIEVMETISYIIACYPAGVCARDGYGRTPLHVALCHGAKGRGPKFIELLCRRLSWGDFGKVGLEEEKMVEASTKIEKYTQSRERNGDYDVGVNTGVESGTRTWISKLKGSNKTYSSTTSSSETEVLENSGMKEGSPEIVEIESEVGIEAIEIGSCLLLEDAGETHRLSDCHQLIEKLRTKNPSGSNVCGGGGEEKNCKKSMVVLSSKLPVPPLPPIPRNFSASFSATHDSHTNENDHHDHVLDFDGTLPCNATVIPDAMHGLLPLHYAVMNGAPMDSIRYLIRLYPNSVACGDRWGRTPLHWVLGAGEVDPASVELIRTDDDGESNTETTVGSSDGGSISLGGRSKRTALTAMAMPFERSNVLLSDLLTPETAVMKDGTARCRTPLHWAVRLIALGIAKRKKGDPFKEIVSLNFIQSLIDAGSSESPVRSSDNISPMLTSTDGDGRTPLNLFFHVLKSQREVQEHRLNQVSADDSKETLLNSVAEFEIPLELMNALTTGKLRPLEDVNVVRNQAHSPYVSMTKSEFQTPIRRGSSKKATRKKTNRDLPPSSYEDNFGILPLHNAVCSFCHPLIIRYIVKSYPPALFSTVLGTGRTPLHMALASPFIAQNLDTSTIETLLFSWPSEWIVTNLGQIVCHQESKPRPEEFDSVGCCAVLGLRVLMIRDCWNRVPLHIATQNQSSLDVIRVLISGNQEAACFVDCNGNLPVHLTVNENLFINISGESVGRDNENQCRYDKNPALSALNFGRIQGWTSDDDDILRRQERDTLRTKICWLIRPIVYNYCSVVRACSRHGLTPLHLSIAFNACPYELVSQMLQTAPNAAQIRTKTCSGMTALDIHQMRKEQFTMEVTEEELPTWNAIQELLFAYYPLANESRHNPNLLKRCVCIIRDECSGIQSFHNNPNTDPTMPENAMMGADVVHDSKPAFLSLSQSLLPRNSDVSKIQDSSFDIIEAGRSGSDLSSTALFSYGTLAIESPRINETFSSGFTQETCFTDAETNDVGNPSAKTLPMNVFSGNNSANHVMHAESTSASHVTLVAPSYDNTSDPEYTRPGVLSSLEMPYLIKLEGSTEVILSRVACRLWAFFVTYCNPCDASDNYISEVANIIDDLPVDVVKALASMPITWCLHYEALAKTNETKHHCLELTNSSPSTVLDCANNLTRSIIQQKIE